MSGKYLRYSDLIDPKRVKDRVLSPKEIPIDPEVCTSFGSFTETDLKAILKKIPDMMKDDISEAGRLLGKDISIWVKSDGIMHNGYWVPFGALRCNSVGGNLSAYLSDSQISISGGDVLPLDTFCAHEASHPLGRERLAKFSFTPHTNGNQPSIATWKAENVDYELLCGLYFYFRSFAIGANNYGLDKIKGIGEIGLRK